MVGKRLTTITKIRHWSKDEGRSLVTERVPLRVLVVEDNAADAELVLRELRRGGFDVESKIVQTPSQLQQQLEVFPPEIVLADYNLGQWRGIEALEMLKNRRWTCRSSWSPAPWAM